MSKVTNGAGTTLLVDEVIQLGKSTKDFVAEFKQQVDAQIMKRNTQRIVEEITLIGSDGYVTPSEKQVLNREYLAIVASRPTFVSKAKEYKIIGQTAYVAYVDAYEALKLFLEPLLADLGTGSTVPTHGDLKTLFSTYYEKANILEEQIFIHTSGLIGGLDDRIKFEIRISGGPTVSSGIIPTTLTVKLLREGSDVTSEYDSSCFSWQRMSSDITADLKWRGGDWPQGKSINVTKIDLVQKQATMVCKFKYSYGEALFYFKTGTVALSEEVPGKDGEDAVSVQIFSSNGDVFRTGQCNTSMSATVWRGSEDITPQMDASLFTWRRSSGDDIADESWNTSSKAIGRKSIDLTPEDVMGRAVFACNVVL